MRKASEDIRDLLVSVFSVISRRGYAAYLVGGFVRDWLLGRGTVDIDIAVRGGCHDLVTDVARAIYGKSFLLDDVNGVFRVVTDRDGAQWHLDFTSFYGSIEEDLARRDFTINAMAVGLQEFISRGVADIIDPFSGRSDLKAGIVRAVSREVFERDAVRLLRAVRLAHELGFTVEPGTEALIRSSHKLVVLVAGERIREELLRMLSLPGSADLIRYMDSLSLLTQIFPEAESMKGVAQPKEHYWDVFLHSVETVAAVEFLLRESPWKYGGERLLDEVPWSDELRAHFDAEVSGGSTRRALLKLGALLHDVAKPVTKTVDRTGRVRFLGHTKQGAAVVALALGRLRFSNREVRLVENLVYNHLRPVQMANEGLPTSRAVYRFFRDTEGAGIDVLFLALADFLATQGPRLDVEQWKRHNRLVRYILEEHRKQQNVVLPAKLIDGHDLMRTFALKPGKLIGELLSEVKEAQVSGDVTTREEAIELVRRSLEKRRCSSAC